MENDILRILRSPTIELTVGILLTVFSVMVLLYVLIYVRRITHHDKKLSEKFVHSMDKWMARAQHEYNEKRRRSPTSSRPEP